MKVNNLEYAGFWVRTGATFIDFIILMLIIYPLLIGVYGWEYFVLVEREGIVGPLDFILTWLMPPVAIILFWKFKQATPGKMAVSARIVDADTGEPPSTAQLIARYFCYTLALLPLGLGLFWIAFDNRKQGWHDKLAGTVVVRERRRDYEAVSFDQANVE